MMSRGETTQSEDGRDCDISENLREGLLWLESKEREAVVRSHRLKGGGGLLEVWWQLIHMIEAG